MEIWLNPACSKCRTAVAALDDAGLPYTVRRYLEDPPTVEELDAVLTRLGLEPWDVVRTGEPAYTALGLEGQDRSPAARATWLRALAAEPSLLQRPIITADDGTTVIARDAETLQRILRG